MFSDTVWQCDSVTGQPPVQHSNLNLTITELRLLFDFNLLEHSNQLTLSFPDVEPLSFAWGRHEDILDIIICFWCLRPIKQVQWLTLRGGCNNFSREIRNYSFVLPLRPFIWMTLSASLVPKFEQLRLLIFQSHLSSPGSLSEVWSVITFIRLSVLVE